MVALIFTGVGEKMPAPNGPVCIALAAPEVLVTAADGAVVPVDKSVVVVEDETELVDGPEVLVLDTASCARKVDDHADRRSIPDKRADSLLISRINRSGSSLGGSKKRAPTNNQYPIGGSFRSIEIPFQSWSVQRSRSNGAGNGNRTRMASLEGWNFTIKLCQIGRVPVRLGVNCRGRVPLPSDFSRRRERVCYFGD